MAPMNLKIIFQNENFVVLDKEPGVLTVPSRKGVEDQRTVLGIELQKFLKKKIFPVHRLDFEVSGIVLFALNEKTHRIAGDWFANRKVHKTYRAFTKAQNFDHWPVSIPCDRTLLNEITSKPLLWKSRILRGKKRSYENPKGDLAETLAEIKKIENEKNQIEWLLHPITGRSHQLRFELSRHGFPILGDQLYGSNVENRNSAIALRAIAVDLSAVGSERMSLPEKIEVDKSIKYYGEGSAE